MKKEADKYFGIDLASKRRLRAYAYPRHMFAHYVYKVVGGVSSTRIGWALGSRDHSTIFKSIDQCEDLMSVDKGFSMAYKSFSDHMSQQFFSGETSSFTMVGVLFERYKAAAIQMNTPIGEVLDAAITLLENQLEN